MIESLINTVIQGDCLDVMKSMPDKCVDLVLTDPPYGINIGKNGHTLAGDGNFKGGNFKVAAREYKKVEWDFMPSKEYFDEIFRISKNQIIFGGNYFLEYLKNTSCFIIWDKDNGNSYQGDCEIAWASFGKTIRKYKYRWWGLLQENMKNKEKRFHPTQKPVGLFEWILNNYSELDMTIFDPFAGSGTTAIACLETGRNYILVEKEPEYVEIINKRIYQWKEQGRLFPANVT